MLHRTGRLPLSGLMPTSHHRGAHRKYLRSRSPSIPHMVPKPQEIAALPRAAEARPSTANMATLGRGPDTSSTQPAQLLVGDLEIGGDRLDVVVLLQRLEQLEQRGRRLA